VFLNPEMSAALDRISERASDIRRAYTPGAIPDHDDISTVSPSSDFTLDPMSVSAPEDTYFIVREGHGRFGYSRDGSLAIRNGSVVNSQGLAICGLNAERTPVELRVDPVDEALGRVGQPSIEADGSVVYRRAVIEPRTGSLETQRVAVGRIALARFPAGTKFEAAATNELRATADVSPQLGVPGDGSFAPLAPHRRERSRIDIDRGLTRLKDAYLAFEALAAAEAAKSHLGKTTMDLVK
jgi:flagellar basal body rod protein FlgG